MTGWLPIVAVAWLVCGIASLLIAQGRGVTNVASWFLVGAILGPLGLILAILGARPSRGQKRDLAMATLRDLANARAAGTLTDEEYESRKRNILGRS